MSDAPISPCRALACAAVLGAAMTWSSPGAAQSQPNPPPSASAGDAWQRQQPTPDRVRELMDRQGVQPSPAERREELRTLNEIHRELMPPGTTVPAPRLAPPGDARSGSSN